MVLLYLTGKKRVINLVAWLHIRLGSDRAVMMVMMVMMVGSMVKQKRNIS